MAGSNGAYWYGCAEGPWCINYQDRNTDADGAMNSIINNGQILIRESYAVRTVGDGCCDHVNVVYSPTEWPEDPPYPTREDHHDFWWPKIQETQYNAKDAFYTTWQTTRMYLKTRLLYDGDMQCGGAIYNLGATLESGHERMIIDGVDVGLVYWKGWKCGYIIVQDFYQYWKCDTIYDCPPGTHRTNGHCCPIGQEWNILEGTCKPVYIDQGPPSPLAPEIVPNPDGTGPGGGDGEGGGGIPSPGDDINCIVSARCDIEDPLTGGCRPYVTEDCESK